MFLTVKEAKEKWCLPPFEDRKCNPDDCMAWRFRSSDLDKGYCGLAGVPLSNMAVPAEVKSITWCVDHGAKFSDCPCPKNDNPPF